MKIKEDQTPEPRLYKVGSMPETDTDKSTPFGQTQITK